MVKKLLITLMTLLLIGAATTGPARAHNNNTVPVTRDNNLDWNFTMPDYDVQVDMENYNGYVLTLACNGNGVVVFSGDTLLQGVTAVPGSTANTYYVVSGTEVTVKARANENYGFENWTNENSDVMGTDSTLTLTISGDSTLTANFVRDFEGSGTEDDPYIISNTEKWTLLSNRVKEGKGYYGKYFLQTDSIFAGRVYVGTYSSATSHRPFGGIYDGGGHALEFLDNNISSMNKANRAPFICVDGATIRNLHITGTIKTYYNFIAGFIARTVTNNRTTTIINCRSSIRIESLRPSDYDGTHGGFVAVTDAAVNFIGCVFDGALIGAKTRSSGGFIGWTEKNASVNFIDCIFAPDSLSMGDSLSCTFSRTRRDTSLHFTNSYYAQAFGKEQGKKLRSITAGVDVTTLGLAGTATVYNVSGITAYADNNGLKYGDMFFAGDTDVVNLTLVNADRTAEGMTFDSYSASNGATINGDTLTMANDSTVVSANYIQNPMLTLNSDGNGTVGFCGDTLPQGVTPGSTANIYYVVSGTEVCIKATPAEHYYMQKWNNEAALNSNEAVNTSFTVTKDTTLTAYFVPGSYNITYTITYMDGQTELNVDTFDYRQPIRDYTTSKEGWNFEGWNPEVPQLMPAENLVVYAQWSRICEPVTDIDHNTYPTVGVGNICWMTENLRTTHYADGREITNIYEYQNEMYPNVQENVSIYGRLYDWYDAVDSARPTRATRVQGICPDGWYLPNEDDFELLNGVNHTDLRSVNYWLINPGTNTTGYDLRPAGRYNFVTSRYEDLRGNAYLWSATGTSSVEAHCHMADCNCYMIIDLVFNKHNAISVRCVKD